MPKTLLKYTAIAMFDVATSLSVKDASAKTLCCVADARSQYSGRHLNAGQIWISITVTSFSARENKSSSARVAARYSCSAAGSGNPFPPAGVDSAKVQQYRVYRDQSEAAERAILALGRIVISDTAAQAHYDWRLRSDPREPIAHTRDRVSRVRATNTTLLRELEQSAR